MENDTRVAEILSRAITDMIGNGIDVPSPLLAAIQQTRDLIRTRTSLRQATKRLEHIASGTIPDGTIVPVEVSSYAYGVLIKINNKEKL